MAAEIDGVFTENLKNEILKSKVLVVGAGGIGCEILKNLVMSGFSDIEIVDMDIIEVSNLNRQFLFQKKHVGRSKAEVAKETALNFNPNVKIIHYHDSITSPDYGLSFFQKFSLVMNALDNRAARNHVNRMCLAVNVPLIESGTAGYEGQVELIKKNLSQCYECTPKAAQKTYPGCTIRNTPSETIHCIIWAKHLFNQLFGEVDPDQDVSPDVADPEAFDLSVQPNLKQLFEKKDVCRKSTRDWAKSCNYDPEKLFIKFFNEDIKYLLSMDNLWKKRRPPTPLDWSNLPDGVPGSSKEISEPGLKDQQRWSIAKCGSVFAQSISNLRKKLKAESTLDNHVALDKDYPLIWDKDDQDAMDFVASCANIRAYIFGIPQKTRFEIKSMAGNIIPAIATSNAIIAGVVVLHAFFILEDRLKECRSVYLRLKMNHKNQLLVPEKYLNPPNPKCYVCAPVPHVILITDTCRMTIQQLEELVLKDRLNMIGPDVMIDGQGVIVISSEEGETKDNNDKTLKQMGLKDGTILKVDDFLQNYVLKITIVHKKKVCSKNKSPEFLIEANEEDLKPKKEKNDTEKPSTSNKKLSVLPMGDADTDGKVDTNKKRKTNANNDNNILPKKRKIDNKGSVEDNNKGNGEGDNEGDDEDDYEDDDDDDEKDSGEDISIIEDQTAKSTDDDCMIVND